MTNAMFFKVEYDTKVFDLTVPQEAFDFIFELYNFLSAAKADNDSFHEPERRLADVKDSVARKQFTPITKRKKEEEETKQASKRSRGPPASGGGRDSLDHPELTRAGYTLTQLPKDFTLLTPVSRDSRQCAR